MHLWEYSAVFYYRSIMSFLTIHYVHDVYNVFNIYFNSLQVIRTLWSYMNILWFFLSYRISSFFLFKIYLWLKISLGLAELFYGSIGCWIFNGGCFTVVGIFYDGFGCDKSSALIQIFVDFAIFRHDNWSMSMIFDRRVVKITLRRNSSYNIEIQSIMRGDQ